MERSGLTRREALLSVIVAPFAAALARIFPRRPSAPAVDYCSVTTSASGLYTLGFRISKEAFDDAARRGFIPARTARGTLHEVDDAVSGLE